MEERMCHDLIDLYNRRIYVEKSPTRPGTFKAQTATAIVSASFDFSNPVLDPLSQLSVQSSHHEKVGMHHVRALGFTIEAAN